MFCPCALASTLTFAGKVLQAPAVVLVHVVNICLIIKSG